MSKSIYISLTVLILLIIFVVSNCIWIPYGIIYNKIQNEVVTNSTCTYSINIDNTCQLHYYTIPPNQDPISWGNEVPCDSTLHNGQQVVCYLVYNGNYNFGTYAFLNNWVAKCHAYNYYYGCDTDIYLIIAASILSSIGAIYMIIYLCSRILAYKKRFNHEEFIPLVGV
ncbi:MAG: hypothetical protein Homavirus30_3 [Homavirus sp.]|uniref:Uncharacterized protein n=1 Tax=Homavirus sp. TaxID=2487769 RepID=A0A3G5A7X5_9VIRU|nr:MAG: hypothetical protein Homavirus30_3 [Homavirus sp.]